MGTKIRNEIEQTVRKVADSTVGAYKQRDWRTLLILENDEPLTLIPEEHCYPYYHKEMDLIPHGKQYLRESVLSKFLEAKSFFDHFGFDLKLLDGWRSIELQENLFWFYMQKFTARIHQNEIGKLNNCRDLQEFRASFRELPHPLQDKLIEANRSYVSLPSTNHNCPSPHSTGGSVDVWLYRGKIMMDFGVPFDWMEETAGAFYHLRGDRSPISKYDSAICWYRNLLIFGMTQAGFSCYPPEFWHFNSGNQMDSLVSGQVAIYSYKEPEKD